MASTTPKAGGSWRAERSSRRPGSSASVEASPPASPGLAPRSSCLCARPRGASTSSSRWGVSSNLSHPYFSPTNLLAAQPGMGRQRDTGARRVVTLLSRLGAAGTVSSDSQPALMAATASTAGSDETYGQVWTIGGRPALLPALCPPMRNLDEAHRGPGTSPSGSSVGAPASAPPASCSSAPIPAAPAAIASTRPPVARVETIRIVARYSATGRCSAPPAMRNIRVAVARTSSRRSSGSSMMTA